MPQSLLPESSYCPPYPNPRSTVEFYRERFIVEKFDIDYDKPDLNLEKELVEHPELRDKLVSMNRAYHALFVTITFVNVVNIFVSGALVFSDEYYNGFRTGTTFVTNVLFMLTRLSTSLMLSQSNAKEIRAQSINLVRARPRSVAPRTPMPLTGRTHTHTHTLCRSRI